MFSSVRWTISLILLGQLIEEVHFQGQHLHSVESLINGLPKMFFQAWHHLANCWICLETTPGNWDVIPTSLYDWTVVKVSLMFSEPQIQPEAASSTTMLLWLIELQLKRLGAEEELQPLTGVIATGHLAYRVPLCIWRNLAPAEGGVSVGEIPASLCEMIIDLPAPTLQTVILQMSQSDLAKHGITGLPHPRFLTMEVTSEFCNGRIPSRFLTSYLNISYSKFQRNDCILLKGPNGT